MFFLLTLVLKQASSLQLTMSLQTGDTPSEKKDVLLTNIANADFSDLKGSIAWRLDDINEAVKQIREITDIYWMIIPTV